MCLKEDDAVGFMPTGIMLEIQDEILGFSVNELAPKKWYVCEPTLTEERQLCATANEHQNPKVTS